MKTLLTLFLSLLLTSISYARLGDTPDEVIQGHPSWHVVSKGMISDRSYVMVFRSQDNLEEVGVLFLDGKCGEEVFSRTDGGEFKYEDCVKYMKFYCDKWIQIPHVNPKMTAAMSGDGKYYAIYGPAPYLRGALALRIFTRTWRDYAKSVSFDWVNVIFWHVVS